MIKRRVLKILSVENSAADADQINDTLVKSGLQLNVNWVNTVQELRKALRTSVWDIVLSNTDVPQLKPDEVL
ncbi:hypothetical protein [Nitrosomonas marina]|uniref:Response regulatory domain-containing protein n=1 Tax=Nitrosomonas marina TaxID=917 RepID=A0A1H8EQE9_9PROT|nr:hypothetical protein [Nitrosomonas marina]SEN21811.1 hypothetical protein SAMN05216325_11084 [Nitrosomonas marina]